MRVHVIGAGPAGLHAATLLKQRRPDADVRVFERNPAGATFGFGVVFSDSALDFLRGDDPQTHDLVAPALERWSDIEVVHRGEHVRIDGVGFAAIGRLELLGLLRRRAAQCGIEPEYEAEVADPASLGAADLVIGADGVNSVVRAAAREAFGERIGHLENHFAWFGAERAFDVLTQTFVDTPLGCFNAHHYRYAPDRSTFIIECDGPTFERAGFMQMSAERSRTTCERLFAGALDGARLVDNRLTWRRFPKLRNARWSVGNAVLVGDALHTAHFSIGSGTRLALEDAIALVQALEAHEWRVDDGLAGYEATRRPILERLVRAADASAAWYERFAEHMALEPWAFARSYLQRTGRVDAERLAAIAPGFATELKQRGLL